MEKRYRFLSFILLLFGLSASAQVDTHATFTISGTIVDKNDGMPMPGATVMLFYTDTLHKKVMVTALDGVFRFSTLRPGEYQLRVSSIGYMTYTTPLTLLSHDTTLSHIGLKEESTMLSAVTITSSVKKKLVENKGDHLVYHASSDMSNKAGNASDVLRKVPMLTVGVGGELKIRGNANIKVLLNGLPSGIMARNLQEALKMIPASTIESIEVITSPSAKYEAEGAGGIINIITKKKLRGTRGTVDLSAGNLEQNISFYVSRSTGKFNFSLTLNANNFRQRSRSQTERDATPESNLIGSLLQQSDKTSKNQGGYANLMVGYTIDSTQYLETSVSFWNGQWPESSRFFNHYQTAINQQKYRQHSKQDGSFNYYEAMLNYRKKFKRPGQEFQFAAQGAISNDITRYTTSQSSLDNISSYWESGNNIGKGKDWNIQADYKHPLNAKGSSSVDLGTSYIGTASQSNFNVYNSSQTGNDVTRSDVMSHFQYTYAAYLSFKLQLADRLSIRPGIRYEYTNLGAAFRNNSSDFHNHYSNLLPGFLVNIQLNDMHEVSINYSERLRRPWIWDLNPFINAGDPLNLTAGNPALKPELVRNIEFGHAYNAASEKVSVNNSFYLNLNSNAIEPITTVNSEGISMTTSQNIASNSRIGANTNLFLKPVRKWSINLGLDLFYLKFRSATLGMLNDGYFYTASLSSNLELPKSYSIQTSGEFGNGFINLQGHTSANYSYRFGFAKEIRSKKIILTLSINNPFSNTFTQRSKVAAPGFESRMIQQFQNRSFSLSFSWRFGGVRNQETEERLKREPARVNQN